MGNQETTGQGTQAQETVDYNAYALNKTQEMISAADPKVFADIYTTIVVAFLGVSIMILSVKKGYHWLMGAIRHAGN